MEPIFLFRRGLVVLFLVLALCRYDAGTALAQNADADSSAPLSFTNAPANNVLDYYEQLSGKHLIRDSALSQVMGININASGLSKEEQLKFLEASLLLNGVSIVPVDDKTAKALSVPAQAKNPRSEGMKIYANVADLPTDEEVVNYYMPLNYLSPVEAGQLFQQHAPPHNYGAYVPIPSAQALILTENVSVIRQLVSLKELIDVPPAAVVSEFIQLDRADAEKVADTLNKLLVPPPGAPGAAGNGVIVPPYLGNNQPLSNERNLISGTVQIIPDARSNRLLVVTRPVNMPFLKSLIAQMDQPDAFALPMRWPLKYVLAKDILPALEAVVAQGKDEEAEVQKDASSASNAATAGTTSQPTNGGEGLATNGSSSGNEGVSSVTSPLQAPKENNVPTVVIIGKTRLMADNRTNSIMVFGSPDAVSRVQAMIDQLDRKPLQVLLSTVIGQLTVSDGQEFGIDILQKFQRVGQGGLSSSLVTPGSATASAANSTTSTTTTGTTTTTGSSPVPEPTSLTSSLGFPLASGLTLYGAIGTTLDAYVRALGTTNRFKVISTPSVYTTNNKLAVIASGSEIPVPGTTVSGLNNNNNLTSSSSTTYEQVLLQLEIIPLINANHEVTLQIRQTNNSEGNSQIISGNSVPTILTQEINTNVTVPDKSTIVIGGLISNNETRKTSGVPWLSDIPLLGYLFKDTSKSKERDELIIMIQPTVVETDADQIATNKAAKRATILGREAEAAVTGIPVSENDAKTRPELLAPISETQQGNGNMIKNAKPAAVETAR